MTENITQFPTKPLSRQPKERAAAVRAALRTHYGDDACYIEACARWRVLRAQQQINWAMDELQTGWGSFPDDDIGLDTNPLFKMRDIENMLADVTPRSALLAQELLGICVTILSCQGDASAPVLGEGPVLEILRNVNTAITLLPHDTKLTAAEND